MSLTAPRKPTTHHKKTQGAHHRRSKHYLKAYHPYLPMLLVVFIGLAMNFVWSRPAPQVLGASSNLNSIRIIEDTNVQRQQAGQSELLVNPSLTAAAQAKADDMVKRNYWSHDGPGGSTPWSFLAASGYDYQEAGENLAYGFRDAGSVVNGWMHSPEHRDNILKADYQEIGIGTAYAQDYQGRGPATVVVAMYGRQAGMGITAMVPGPSASAESGSAAAPQTLAAFTSQPMRSVSRLSSFAAGSPLWSVAALSVIMLLALAFLVFRHAIAWHKVLVRSEQFILHHKKLDVVVLTLIVVCVLLTRTAGFIG